MTSTYRFVLIILIALVLCASAVAEDGVELPVEFYLGRWTPGHNFDGIMRWQKGNDTKDVGSYFYQHGKYRVGLNNIKEYFLFETASDPDTFRTADFSFQYRPKRNWQIGLEKISYQHNLTDKRYTSPYSGNYHNESGAFGGTLSSSWSNKLASSLNRSSSAFAYMGRPILGQGHILVENSITYGYRSWSTEDSRGDFRTGRRREYSSESDGNNWKIVSEFQYGLSEAASLSFATVLLVTDEDDMGVYSNAFGDSVINSSQSSRSLSWYRPQYSLDLNYRPYGSLMFSGEILQTFWEWTEKLMRNSTNRENVSTLDTVISEPLQEASTNIGFSIDWLSLGDFDSQVLLDDYSGFYRQMLFHRQLHVRTSIRWISNGVASRADYRYITLSQRLAYGLYNQYEFSIFANYRRSSRGDLYGSEHLDASLKVRYRSYQYESGTGAGWYQDNPADILFGAILPPWEFFLSFEYEFPQQWNSANETIPGFLSMTNLKSTHTTELNSTMEVGLGKNAQLKVSSALLIYHSNLIINYYDLEVTGRVYGKVNISFGLEGLYRKAARNDPPATIRIRVQTII